MQNLTFDGVKVINWKGNKKNLQYKICQFADLEAEEVGGSGGEEDEGIDEELIDDTGAPMTDAGRAKLRKKMNQELQDQNRDLAARGPLAVEELCIKLMWKAFEELKSGQTVPVYSVFHVPYVKGYIYLEAHREADVRRFTKGINGVSQYTGLSLVPLDQMAGVFSAAVAHAQKVKVIQQGDWVRLKRGPYRGDLAQVAEIDDDSHTLKIKPRMSGGQVAKNNKKIFPPKWFHKGDVEATGQVVVNVEPRRTNQGHLDLPLALFDSGSPTVLIRPLNVDVTSELSIANSRLCKYFEIGDYVTVMSGDHVGDAGHVEQVELGPSKTWGSHATARILTADYSSFRASLNDPWPRRRRRGMRDESHQKVGEFRVGQLVMVAGQDTRAIIVRLEAGDRAMVLGPNARKTYVSLAELQPVQLPRRCLEECGFPVTSEVLYIHQGWVFLRAIEGLVGERAYLVAPGDKCEYVWDPDDLPKGKGRGKGGQRMKIKIPEKTEEELSSKTFSFGIKMASQLSFLRPTWYKQIGLSERQRGGPTGGILSRGSSVKITGGNYKGMRGEIRDLLEDRVRISLLSAPKLVEVSVNDVREDDYTMQIESDHLRGATYRAGPRTPSAAPMPAPKVKKSAEQEIADGIDKVPMPTDDQAWDPLWLELGSGDTSAPITPALSIVSTSRRRRKTRLDANLMAETEAGDETRGECSKHCVVVCFATTQLKDGCQGGHDLCDSVLGLRIGSVHLSLLSVAYGEHWWRFHPHDVHHPLHDAFRPWSRRARPRPGIGMKSQ
eukprot:g33125.t1